MAFHAAGCAVDVVCPSGHPVLSTRTIQNHYVFRGLAPLRSIQAAIFSSKPDIVLPCDDLTVMQLHHLYTTAISSDDMIFGEIRHILERSLGDPASFPFVESREKFMALAQEQGVLTPATITVNSAKEVEDWLSAHQLPAVLKAEGTSGGEGVRIVHSLQQALQAYETLRAPLAALIVAKRTVLDGDRNYILPWLMQRQRTVSIQTFVSGVDANIAVACWRGEVLSTLSAVVLNTWKPKGPATVVRLQDNEEILNGVTTILRKLKFSGLCGFDFMIDNATRRPYLLEMNARVTQTCPLSLGPGRDLIGALCTAVSGQCFSIPSINTRGDTIALFPLAWQGDMSDILFRNAYHDIPWEEPQLVSCGMKLAHNISRDTWKRWLSKIGLYRP